MSTAPASKAAPKALLDLLAARGPSGYETAPAAVWRDAAEGFAEVSIDVVGTPLALVAPKHDARSPARRLLLRDEEGDDQDLQHAVVSLQARASRGT